MNDFKVIEGGGMGRDPGVRDGIHGLAIELLRGIANGDDRRGAVGQEICRLSVALIKDDIHHLDHHVSDRMEAMHSLALVDAFDTMGQETNAILKAALRLVADRLSGDQAAKSRAAKSEHALFAAVERFSRARSLGENHLLDETSRIVSEHLSKKYQAKRRPPQERE